MKYTNYLSEIISAISSHENDNIHFFLPKNIKAENQHDIGEAINDNIMLFSIGLG
jgi:hypothetical protein